MADSERERLSELVHGLNDIELAMLLCLVAGRHCILTTDADQLPRLEHEAELIAAQAFGLTTATVPCSPELGLDEFVGALLVEEDKRASSGISSLLAQESIESYQSFRGPLTSDAADPFSSARKRIPNVLIIRDLDRASLHIQTQVLELMRTRRIVTRRSMLETPDCFLIIALLPKTNTQPALLRHLRENFFISHHHAPPHDQSEEDGESLKSDSDSFASVVVRKHPPSTLPRISTDPYIPGHTAIPYAVIEAMREFAADVSISTEIRRYLLDIVVFLRMHRAVRGGMTAQATSDFELLVKCLAPLHNLDFVTPALVSLAAFKIYHHRLELAQKAEDERSIMWGSSPAAVEAYLKQIDAEVVIEEVLSSVKAPL